MGVLDSIMNIILLILILQVLGIFTGAGGALGSWFGGIGDWWSNLWGGKKDSSGQPLTPPSEFDFVDDWNRNYKNLMTTEWQNNALHLNNWYNSWHMYYFAVGFGTYVLDSMYESLYEEYVNNFLVPPPTETIPPPEEAFAEPETTSYPYETGETYYTPPPESESEPVPPPEEVFAPPETTTYPEETYYTPPPPPPPPPPPHPAIAEGGTEYNGYYWRKPFGDPDYDIPQILIWDSGGWVMINYDSAVRNGMAPSGVY